LSNSNDSCDEAIEELESIRGEQQDEHQSTGRELGGALEEELESTRGEQQEEHLHAYIHIHEDQERY
jgi:hypothetical protein